MSQHQHDRQVWLLVWAILILVATFWIGVIVIAIKIIDKI